MVSSDLNSVIDACMYREAGQPEKSSINAGTCDHRGGVLRVHITNCRITAEPPDIHYLTQKRLK